MSERNSKQALVEQSDRNAAADFYGPHLARPGEVLVTAHMRAGKIDDSALIQAFARHRQDHIASVGKMVATPNADRAGVEALREALEWIVAKNQIPRDDLFRSHSGKPLGGTVDGPFAQIARTALSAFYGGSNNG